MTCAELWDKNQRASDKLEQPFCCPAGLSLIRFSSSLVSECVCVCVWECDCLLALAGRPSGQEQMLHPHTPNSPNRVCWLPLSKDFCAFLCSLPSHLTFQLLTRDKCAPENVTGQHPSLHHYINPLFLTVTLVWFAATSSATSSSTSGGTLRHSQPKPSSSVCSPEGRAQAPFGGSLVLPLSVTTHSSRLWEGRSTSQQLRFHAQLPLHPARV